MAVWENVLICAIKILSLSCATSAVLHLFLFISEWYIYFFFFCSTSALLERVSEIENRCAEKLREMEFRVDTAKKEHTKAGSGISGMLSQAFGSLTRDAEVTSRMLAVM